MGAPQIIMIVLIAISLTDDLVNHGRVEIKRQNFWRALLATAILIALLHWGGFF